MSGGVSVLCWHRHQNKTFIRGASPGVSDELRNKNAIGWQRWDLATQEYGNWNRHVCRKGKCEVDRPYRLTGANPSIDALNLNNILNQNKNPSKVIFLHTLKIRSRHAFHIAIQVRLLPKFSTTKKIYSKSTSKVFLRFPYLVPALVLSFFMLHVVISWQVISISYKMTN